MWGHTPTTHNLPYGRIIAQVVKFNVVIVLPFLLLLFNVNFENLTVALYVIYIIFNMHVKFYLNQMLFTIISISLFFVYNFLL